MTGEAESLVSPSAVDYGSRVSDHDNEHDSDITVRPAPPGHRTGFVGIIGRPNVGKSTLLNRLVGEHIAIATPKPQTTRDRIRGIRTFADWQVIFVDTPGIHEARTRLNRYMVDLAFSTLDDVDVAYLLVDVPSYLEKPERRREEIERIAQKLAEHGTKALLVLNKIDKVKDKAQLLTIIEALAAVHGFEAFLPVSARTGEGTDTLLAETRARLPEGPPLFDADELTDRPLRFIVKELIREPLIMQLGQELPYNAAVHVDHWAEGERGGLVIHATIVVNKKSHKPIVVGKGGARIKAIGQAARERIERYLERKMFLDLRVKVDEDWIERPASLKELGYDEK